MKKLFKVVAAIAMCLTLVACGETKEANTWSDQLIEEGKITFATSPDYPPYETIENGEMVGFDIDMANALGEILGVEIAFESMSFDTIIDAVNLGQVDCGVAAFTYDKDRQVGFSDYYLKSAQVVIVKADSDIKTLDDLKGKTIGCQLGTTGASAASEIEEAKVELNKDAKILVESLKQNQLDAVVADVIVAQNYVDNNEGLAILDEALIDEENSIITAQGNTLLLEKLNEAIAEFKASDKYQELKTKWGM